MKHVSAKDPGIVNPIETGDRDTYHTELERTEFTFVAEMADTNSFVHVQLRGNVLSHPLAGYSAYRYDDHVAEDNAPILLRCGAVFAWPTSRGHASNRAIHRPHALQKDGKK